MPFFRLLKPLSQTTFKRYVIASATLFFCLAAAAETPLSKEYKLKAAYLLNFTKFIEWRNAGTSEQPHDIRICVADDSPEFLQFFRQLSADKRVGKMRHSVKILALDADTECELLYLKTLPVPEFIPTDRTIIVADSDQTSVPGTAVVFYQDNRKLRFEIDLKTIKALNIVVSSELLKLAKIK